MCHVSMPSRASTSFLPAYYKNKTANVAKVSMPSRASTSFLHWESSSVNQRSLTVSMPSRASTSFLPQLSAAQEYGNIIGVNALSG